jgi:multidrug efflux pump subunit AcrA (membrane-fusion protein)
VAKREYELLGKKMTEVNRDLVLREPQLASARASVLSAQVALDQARLELERTSIEAPFNAQILTRNVNVGSQVEPGIGLARLVGIDEYWVIVTVPVAKLDQVAFPRNGEKGSPVRIVNRTAWPEGKYRQGRIKRLIGALDEQTRLARVLVSVSDPLALKESTKGPKMIVGTVVQAEIEGRPLSNVFRINRDHLREEETLWIKKDGKLEIRDAVVVFQDKQYAYLSEGLVNGDQIVTSNLATVAQGVLLRTESENRDNVKMGK